VLHYKPNEAYSITYPYCFEHKVFDRQELKKIITYCDSLPKETGKVGNSLQIYEKILSESRPQFENVTADTASIIL